MFSDQFLDKEENGKVFDVIIDYLTSEKVCYWTDCMYVNGQAGWIPAEPLE
jgi:hypothetical protein